MNLNDKERMKPDRAKAAKKKIARLDPVCAYIALKRYKYFLCFPDAGGKRPLIHDSSGRVIAPVCPELIPALEKRACIKIWSVAPWWSRQDLRAMRRKRHKLNTLANQAFDLHASAAKSAGDISAAA